MKINSILKSVHYIYTISVVCSLAMPKLVLDLTQCAGNFF